jgi:hypothetical protein
LEATTPDGQAKVSEVRAGQVTWAVAGAMHSTANLTRTAVRLIEIELKQPGPEKDPCATPTSTPYASTPRTTCCSLKTRRSAYFAPHGNPAVRK